MAQAHERTNPPSDPTASLSIGMLATRTGVSAETIRFYERDGVIPPAKRGGNGGYRLYGAVDERRLRFVRRARELGFGLEDVRGLLVLAAGDGERPCADINVLAKTHLAQVETKLAQLHKLHRELARLISACDHDASIAECSLLDALSDHPSALG